jgi:hypothetical protein
VAVPEFPTGPSLHIPTENGPTNCIPLGLNFKVVQYERERVTEHNYRNGKFHSTVSSKMTPPAKYIRRNGKIVVQTGIETTVVP